MDHFARAAELDPNYVHAHAWLAIELCIRYMLDEQEQTVDEAAVHARKALALDENDAYAHDAMGWVALRRRQFDLAGEHYQRACRLNPNDINIAGDTANWLLHIGRLHEALRVLDLAVQRDPYPPTWIWEVRGVTLYHLKRYDGAITALRSVQTRHFLVSMHLAAAYAQAGEVDDARRELANYLLLKPNNSLANIAPKIEQVLRDHLLDGLRKAGLPESVADFGA